MIVFSTHLSADLRSIASNGTLLGCTVVAANGSRASMQLRQCSSQQYVGANRLSILFGKPASHPTHLPELAGRGADPDTRDLI